MVSIYIRAMGYSSTISGARQSAWNTHSRYLGFHSVAAIEHSVEEEPNPKNPTQPIRGFIYGYRGGNGQWWNTQVKAALMIAGVPPSLRIQLLDNYTELTEIHVDPSWQGNNIGRRLLTIFAGSLTSQRLLLSTPKSPVKTTAHFTSTDDWDSPTSFGTCTFPVIHVRSQSSEADSPSGVTRH